MKTVALLFLLVALCNCDCVTSSAVEKAFKDYKIVPDILSVAPTNFLTVWHHQIQYFFKIFLIKLSLIICKGKIPSEWSGGKSWQ